ncbi:uncharacterized protein LOC144108239 [Amblyomma americanum]
MNGTEYVLAGFGGFLERRPVVFVEPLPNNRVCGVCCMVASRSFLLPCCHVVCESCKSSISNVGYMCPLDGRMFAEDDVLPMTLEPSYFGQRRVLCVAGGEKCAFRGKLLELKDHLAECDSDEIRCVKCLRYILPINLIEHCQLCSGEALEGSTVSSSAVGSPGEKLRALKKDVEDMRYWALSKCMGHDAVINEASSVVERMTSIACQLADMEQQARYEHDVSVLAVAKKVTYSPQLFRAASKLGAFIESYLFVDAYGAYNSLTGDKKEHVQSHGTHISAGYAIELQSQCRRQEGGDVLVSFTLILHDCVWDAMLEWPFSKKPTVILRHPIHPETDIRMPVSANSNDMVRRPVPGIGNRGFQTEPVNWRDLDLQGFIHNNYIYVIVKLE